MSRRNRNSDYSAYGFEQTVRFYTESGLWYFNTREGTQIGPFRYRTEAEAMLHRFLDKVTVEDARKV